MFPRRKGLQTERKNSVLFLPKNKVGFNSKGKHHKKKIPLKKPKTYHLCICLSTYLPIYAPESSGKTKHHKTDFPLQIITSEAVWLVFPSVPPVRITSALLVLPWLVGQTPHLVCHHQLLNIREELYSTDLCQWGCIWEIIVHWVYLLQSLSQEHYGHSMSLEIKQNELYK